MPDGGPSRRRAGAAGRHRAATSNDPDLSRATRVGLSPRYSFDTFIVGASNQFAHAACRAVAEAPSRSYNPLFLYGGVGLGKTHLMHAIGHYVLTHSPGLKLTYISAERFMNEVVNAIRYDRILEFRERYRGVDVLLVDDIQFIVGKERTQTEFFHTFNALHDAQKQIVLSSDCPPHQITELEERLRSRFEWGLIADIQPPDLETKIAILKRKAEAEGVPLPDDVALYIAGRIKSNIRELEGSLIRLLAYASLTGRELSMTLAQEVLRDVLRHEERAVTIDMIQKFVAEYYQLKLVELKSRNNSKSVAMPRQVAMYLCKSLTNASLPEIGKSFGGKHHSTVIHSIRKVEEHASDGHVFQQLDQHPDRVVSLAIPGTMPASVHSRPQAGLWTVCGGGSGGEFSAHSEARYPQNRPQKHPQAKWLIENDLQARFRVPTGPYSCYNSLSS